MARKDSPVAEPTATPVVDPVVAIGEPLIVTPKDRILFETCIELTGLGDHRRRLAYFSVGPDGITAHGTRLPWGHCPWDASAA